MSRFDVLIAEIGSTTTIVNACGIDPVSNGGPGFLGQGYAPTSLDSGDVRTGLNRAMEACMRALGTAVPDGSLPGPAGRFLATSSAAGGLRMTVHGLAYDMTVRAAREAALGAGANIHQVTAGIIRPSDLKTLIKIRPNIILIAGGVDYGERETALENSRLIAQALKEAGLAPPVIYGGNVENREEIERVFTKAAIKVSCIDNVYPRIDELNVEPARKVIRMLFEEHITRAPGMEHIREVVNGPIIPTPGAVMLAAELLAEDMGDLLVIDVGGATTDVHSVTSGNEEITRMQTAPEPKAKRTVEGDLGLFINRNNVSALSAPEELASRCGTTAARIAELLETVGLIPETAEEVRLMEELTFVAARTALLRHAGVWRDLYGPSGRTRVVEGKDLTAVKTVIGTGGALTRLPGGRDILCRILSENSGNSLTPPGDAGVLIDTDYSMACLGAMSAEFPEAALTLLKSSLRISTIPEKT